jgi:hypothetical protein
MASEPLNVTIGVTVLIFQAHHGSRAIAPDPTATLGIVSELANAAADACTGVPLDGNSCFPRTEVRKPRIANVPPTKARPGSRALRQPRAGSPDVSAHDALSRAPAALTGSSIMPVGSIRRHQNCFIYCRYVSDQHAFRPPW